MFLSFKESWLKFHLNDIRKYVVFHFELLVSILNVEPGISFLGILIV